MPKLEAMMPSSTDLFPIQLAFYFCLFGFFGTILSTSMFLKWQKKRSDDDDLPPPAMRPPITQKQPSCDSYRNPLNGNVHVSQSDLNAYAHAIFQHHMTHNPPHALPEHDHTHHPVAYNQGHQAYHKSYFNLKVPHYQPYYLPNHNHGIHNTQIILDWDDTLFPTAYTLLNMKNGKTNSKYIDDYSWRQLEALTNTVLHLLMMFVELFGASNICIVTNAKLSWWNDSCLMYKNLFGHIHDLVVNQYNIKVISAHDLYSRKKSSAFMDVLSNKRNISQVICIGDSTDEYEAIHSVCSVLRMGGKRSINYYRFKLIESPSLNAMIQQLENIIKLNYYVISKQRYDQSYTF